VSSSHTELWGAHSLIFSWYGGADGGPLWVKQPKRAANHPVQSVSPLSQTSSFCDAYRSAHILVDSILAQGDSAPLLAANQCLPVTLHIASAAHVTLMSICDLCGLQRTAGGLEGFVAKDLEGSDTPQLAS
jgi:hypothetical protein